MFVVGIIIHLMLLFSIFDIYFKSPIVKDVVSYQPLHDPPADRLVLFVVDGLRAESFVNYTTMPYLRSVANTHGRWGISNTQVPTESRPGHVAIIAGFYEDPSAVTKGWKENVVDFDSVFNQSKFTWCWGTYDIIEIFTKGPKSNKIISFKLDPYSDAFSSDKNTTHLDSWVFEKVKEFFHNAKRDEELKKRLFSDKIIFFLHLLGTDTSGHTHKPKTENFLTTIKFVDDGINEIEMIMKEFYNDDGKTTFLMTSDHGMTDWGSHGSSDDHEIQTPYVIWGAGVQQVKRSHMDPSTLTMSLEHRLDIHQTDLTPLMSTLLSIPVPVNSVGRLTAELLNISLPNKAKAIYSNSRQLAAQYNKKRKDVENNAISLLYYPFKPFSEQKYSKIIEFTEKLLADEDFEKLFIFSEDIMRLSLKGLNYYHNYYQKPLLMLVTLSFMGWIVLLLKVLAEQRVNIKFEMATMLNKKSSCNLFSNILFLLLWFMGTCLVYVQNLPLQYYLYTSVPVLLWWYATSSFELWKQTISQLIISRGLRILCIESVCYILGSMALGFSFSYRWMLSIPLLGMGIWPLLSTSRKVLRMDVLAVWFASSLLLSLFSFIPVVGKQVFIELVIAAGVVWLAVKALFVWHLLRTLRHRHSRTENINDVVFVAAQAILLSLSLQNIYAQSVRFERRTPVSYVHQSMAWIIAVVSLVSPLMSSRRIILRLLAVNTSLLTFYLLLSVSHEGFFMVTLISNVTCWILIEFQLVHLETAKVSKYSFGEDNIFGKSAKNLTDVERSISHKDFRRAFFFVLYIMLAFFGTGNVASLNSFEVRWVTCFITSFKPFIITGLILLKTLAPFMVVACSFRAVQLVTKAPTGYLNLIVLIYSNIMGIQLLYYVKNTGSWLEIGTSISQFVIVQVITLFIVIINQIAKILTSVSVNEFANKVFRRRKKQV